MNKRGFLLGEETIKIIIAVIAIGFLIALVVMLYKNFSSNQQMDQAKASLSNLITELNAGATQAQVYNPQGWDISSFPAQSVNVGSNTVPIKGDIMPKSCSSVGWKSCICIYKLSGSDITGANPANSADKEGTCQQSDFTILGSAPNLGKGGGYYTPGVDIKNPPVNLVIDQSAKTIKSASAQYT